MNPDIRQAVNAALQRHEAEVVALLQQLVRIPSVNHPPTGDEMAVQQFYLKRLSQLGLETELFEPMQVPAFLDHPGRLKDHDMTNRPDVVGTRRGAGGGKSLMIVAHADVDLPGDASLWSDGDPFSGAIRSGRLYGRGAGDDKCGMAINAMAPAVLQSAGLRLKGDLIVASVSDEEQAGSNGSVALVAKGHTADAILNTDALNQEVVVECLGGGCANLDLRFGAPVVDALPLVDYFESVREAIEAFRKQREQDFMRHPSFGRGVFGRRAVRLMNIRLGCDDATHGTALVWFYLLPGEDAAVLQRRFENALKGEGQGMCRIEWMSRFVLPAQIEPSHALVECFSEAFRRATGRDAVLGCGGMSDQGFLSTYGKAACISFGPSRPNGVEGGVHGPDEYVEIVRLLECLKTVVYFVTQWCGVA